MARSASLTVCVPARAPATPPPSPRWAGGLAPAALALPALALLAPGTAQAHVKWFCAYDVASQPLALGTVLSRAFVVLALVSALGLWVGTWLARSGVGETMARGLDVAGRAVRDRIEAMMRAAYATFFACLFTLGGLILTPELFTVAPWVPWLQGAIAACLLFRATLVPAALGMVVLFATGVRDYGVFHMMDYPIFLGAALYFAIVGLQARAAARASGAAGDVGRRPRGVATWPARVEAAWGASGLRPVDVLRWAAAITLMWASVEKWAYPEWTYPLLLTHTHMTMGLAPDFYMTAAGLVEFGLAFALVCAPLVSRLSAIVLTALFTSAIAEFGRIDAIGHLPIIVILVAVIVDNRKARAPRAGLVPVGYAAALAGVVALYYGVHLALFGPGAA